MLTTILYLLNVYVQKPWQQCIAVSSHVLVFWSPSQSCGVLSLPSTVRECHTTYLSLTNRSKFWVQCIEPTECVKCLENAVLCGCIIINLQVFCFKPSGFTYFGEWLGNKTISLQKWHLLWCLTFPHKVGWGSQCYNSWEFALGFLSLLSSRMKALEALLSGMASLLLLAWVLFLSLW